MTDKTDIELMQQEIEAALAQPEQKPVAGVVIREGLPTLLQDKHIKSTDQRLYTAPQQREWQGAFFDAVYEAWHSAGMDVLGGDWNTFASTLEAKLKEKTHERVC